MYRPFRAALLAALISGGLGAAADAQTHVPLGGSQDGQTVSAMPAPDADLVMWSAAPARFRHATARRHPDSMHRLARGIVRRTSSLALHLTRNAMRFIGTPYVFGGTTSLGFDCSGYVQHVYAMLGIALPRTADAQFYAGRPTRGGKLPGDLVFFQTYEAGPSHVGIYLGHGHFIHSSSSRGVTISSIADSYWSARYLGAKRVARVVPRLPAALAVR